jgi:hypothetical protein
LKTSIQDMPGFEPVKWGGGRFPEELKRELAA